MDEQALEVVSKLAQTLRPNMHVAILQREVKYNKKLTEKQFL